MEKNDTLKFYDENASSYFDQTVNGDMSEAYSRFMMFLPDKAYIIDFGCGSGRDSKYFLSKGYTVDAIDGSSELCKLASSYIGQEVKCMRFDELDKESTYDGIWACSSILHVEREELPTILRKMITALKENGVIYTCFKLGDFTGMVDGKYYNYMTRELLEDMLHDLNESVEIVDYYESGTVKNVNRPTAQWGNYLIKKINNI
jgi:SAM-dependent methyltransferase